MNVDPGARRPGFRIEGYEQEKHTDTLPAFHILKCFGLQPNTRERGARLPRSSWRSRRGNGQRT